MSYTNKVAMVTASLVTALVLSAAPASADVVAPAAGATALLGSNNGFPFNVGAFGLSGQLYQQAYAAADFGTSSLSITGVAFRSASGYGAFGPATLPGLTITLGTSQHSVTSLSSTFADNLGTDATVVFTGPATLSSAGTLAFDAVITFTKAFVYNPSAGDLLLQVNNYGGGSTTQFDSGYSPDISRVFTYSPYPSGSGYLGIGNGLATKFLTGSVPEPTTWSLLLIGFGTVGYALRAAPRRRTVAA